MSRQRQASRAAREAARAEQRDRAARDRARREVRRRRLARVRGVVGRLRRPAAARRRPQRYGAMPARTRWGLVLAFLLVQFVGWQLLSRPTQRLGLALVTLLAVPLVITLWLSPRSSR